MKKKDIFFIFSILLMGCSNQMEPIKEDNVSEKVEALQEVNNGTDVSDVSEVETNLENSDIPTVEKENILIDDYVVMSDLTIDTYLSIGEKSTLSYGEDSDGEWEISLDGYFVADDDFGSERKALVLNFTHTNIKSPTSKIEGFFNLMEPDVIYNGMKLGLQDSTETVLHMNEDPSAYENGNRLGYGDYVTESYSCKRVGFVKENQTDSCYTYYSYAGPGEYIIIFEDLKGQKATYKITVE